MQKAERKQKQEEWTGSLLPWPSLMRARLHVDTCLFIYTCMYMCMYVLPA